MNFTSTQKPGTTDGNDRWVFPWNNERYQSRNVYLRYTESEQARCPFKWIWKSCCQSKQKFFFWLLIQDRLNTKDMMARKNFFVQDMHCVLCDESINEDVTHLFFGCQFSHQFWWMLELEWNTDSPLIGYAGR